MRASLWKNSLLRIAAADELSIKKEPAELDWGTEYEDTVEGGAEIPRSWATGADDRWAENHWAWAATLAPDMIDAASRPR
jgi:hypothetical protein